MTETTTPPRAGRAYAGVLFDFEGTLVDFQWRLAPAEQQLRSAFMALGFGGDDFSSGNYAAMWNAAVTQWLAQGRLAELRAAVYPIYDAWDADALTRWALRPGAHDTLKALIASGVRIGMVSNIGRQALDAALERFDLAGMLSPVISRNEVRFMKPDAEGIRRALTDWRLPAEATLFVGDSLADVRGARAAEVTVAIIKGGEAGEEAFRDHPPDYMVANLVELIDLVSE